MTPPLHSSDAERSVLSALIVAADHLGPDPSAEMLADVRELLPAEAFYFATHRLVFELIVELFEKKRPWGQTSLTQLLTDCGRYEWERGDEAPAIYIAELTLTPSPLTGYKDHAHIVREKWTRRRLQGACQETLKALAEEQDGDMEKLLAAHSSQVLSVAEGCAPRDNFRLPKEGVMNAMNRLQDAYANRGGITGLPSGLMDLDRTTSGARGGQMIVIAGSTGMGKTAFMLQWAKHLAVECGQPVAIFSLEMSYDELVERALYGEARVSLQRARDGMLAAADFTRFHGAAERVASAKLYIDDWSGLNILQMQARARHAVKNLGCRMLFGDYVQLFEGVDERDNDRVRELARISRGIKLCAKGNNVPFAVGAQYNRKPDERSGMIVINPYVKEDNGTPMKFKRLGIPQLGDLRECGAIGQDADLVVSPYRPWYWSKQDDDLVHRKGHLEWAQFMVLKQRNGPVGSIICQYQADECRFITCPDENGNERKTMMTNNPEQRQAALHSEEEEPEML